mmetsp:Transcript_16995/g.39018  ORF Transcript_16995/g.39018 Transcript_16995/m.39018 type:complete len:88 (+) Transcript_16995:1078-1341(+)
MELSLERFQGLLLEGTWDHGLYKSARIVNLEVLSIGQPRNNRAVVLGVNSREHLMKPVGEGDHVSEARTGYNPYRTSACRSWNGKRR